MDGEIGNRHTDILLENLWESSYLTAWGGGGREKLMRILEKEVLLKVLRWMFQNFTKQRFYFTHTNTSGSASKLIG
jgi:hypothetical protein